MFHTLIDIDSTSFTELTRNLRFDSSWHNHVTDRLSFFIGLAFKVCIAESQCITIIIVTSEGMQRLTLHLHSRFWEMYVWLEWWSSSSRHFDLVSKWKCSLTFGNRFLPILSIEFDRMQTRDSGSCKAKDDSVAHLWSRHSQCNLDFIEQHDLWLAW